MIVTPESRAAGWVAANIPGCERGFGQNQSFAVWDGRCIVAGVVFHNWNPESGVIEVSSAATSPKWATRGVLRRLFGYAFDECGCRMVVARISEKNERARRLWRAFGSAEYVIPELRGENEAEALYTLTKEAWKGSRFMRRHNG